jgi:superfamily II DNA/RNA helicase
VEAGPVFIPCRYLDSPNRADRLPTAHRVHANALSASQQREGTATLRNFSDLGLSAPILGALAADGYAAPTPIQFQAIPPVLGGRDLCGTAQTGTSRPPPSCYQPASGSALASRRPPFTATNPGRSANERSPAFATATRVLVATDIVVRGIDVDGVSHVINFELPDVPEDYVHRVGRTARAGAPGIAIAFSSGEERPYLRDIEKQTRCSLRAIPVPSATSAARNGPIEPPAASNLPRGAASRRGRLPRDRPSRPGATPAVACQRRHPARRTARCRSGSGIPAPRVANQPRRTARPLCCHSV